MPQAQTENPAPLHDLQAMVDALLAEIDAATEAIEERLSDDPDAPEESAALGNDAMISDMGAHTPLHTEPAAATDAPPSDDAGAEADAEGPVVDGQVQAMLDAAKAAVAGAAPPAVDVAPAAELGPEAPAPATEPAPGDDAAAAMLAAARAAVAGAAPVGTKEEKAAAPSAQEVIEAEVDELVDDAVASAEPGAAPEPGPEPESAAEGSPGEPPTIEEIDTDLAAEADAEAVEGDFLDPSQVEEETATAAAAAVETVSAKPAGAPEAKAAAGADASTAPIAEAKPSVAFKARLAGLLAPVAAVCGAPLRKLSPATRDIVGYLAAWNLFLGACVVTYAAIRPSPGPAVAHAASHQEAGGHGEEKKSDGHSEPAKAAVKSEKPADSDGAKPKGKDAVKKNGGGH